MSLDYVKGIAGDNPQIELIYKRVTELLLDRLEETGVTEVPRRLEYIVEELTLEKFNRIGDEGVRSTSVEGHSVTYLEDSGVLDRYERAIRDFIVEETGTGVRSGVVYFL